MKNQVEETRQLEQELSAQPNNLQLAMQLAKAYASRQRVDALDNLVNQLVAHPELPPGEFLQLANLYGSLNRVDRLLALLGMFTQRYPQNPTGWYNLACVQSLRNNCGESIPALQRALALDNEQGQIHALARQDPKLNNCRRDARFQRLLEQPAAESATGLPFNISR